MLSMASNANNKMLENPFYERQTHNRDGLEKMEREKFKQAERDREMKERDQKRKQDKLIERSLLMQLNAADPASAMIPKSKFVCNTFSFDLSLVFCLAYVEFVAKQLVLFSKKKLVLNYNTKHTKNT